MEIDLKELRKITTESIEEGKRLHQQKMVNDSKEELLRHEEAKKWAESKLVRVPSICKEEAMKGKSEATVLTTKGDGYSVVKSGLYDQFNEWNTKTDGLKYHYFCEGLKNGRVEYEVKYQHDGVGIESWYSIVVGWS